MAESPEQTHTKVGIISLGAMGTGIAELLLVHGFSVATNITGRRCVQKAEKPQPLRYQTDDMVSETAKTLKREPREPR